jgi:hypothetical protein
VKDLTLSLLVTQGNCVINAVIARSLAVCATRDDSA